MGKFLGGHILLVLMILAIEGLHGDVFVVTRCTQQKLFKENEGSGEPEQTIAIEEFTRVI